MLVNVINYLDFIKKELYDNNIGEYMETKLEDKKGLNNNLKFGIICLGITIVIAIIMIIIFSNKKGENGEILLLENVKTIYVGEKKKIKAHVSNSSDAILNYSYNPVFWYIHQLILLTIISPIIYSFVIIYKSEIILFISLSLLIILDINMPFINEDAIIYYSFGALLSRLYKEKRFKIISTSTKYSFVCIK